MQDNQDEIYKAIIGPKNQDYYLNKFSHFDSNGKAGVSWHWPAFFITFFWLLYRKMWANAFLYIGLTWVLGKIMDFFTPSFSAIPYTLYFFVLMLLPPIFANSIYYSHCNEKIKETKNISAKDSEDLLKQLSEKGGVSRAALIFAIISIICMVGIVVAIAIPTYQDYLMRVRNS